MSIEHYMNRVIINHSKDAQHKKQQSAVAISKTENTTKSPVVTVSSDDSVYCDVYTHIADIIEPHVDRFGSEGELPASVTDSFNIIFNFWVANKNKSPRITEQDAREIIESAICCVDLASDVNIESWLHYKGRDLLNKLNAKSESSEEIDHHPV